MVKIYFSQTAGLYSLSVQIEDKRDQRMVFHKVYPPHTVAQFSDHVIYNPDDALKDYALTISNLSHKCKNLSITLEFSGHTTEKTPAPSCFFEFYGKIEERLEQEAALSHQIEIDALPVNSKTDDVLTSIGQSIKFYTHKTQSEVCYIPINSKPAEAKSQTEESTVKSSDVSPFTQIIIPTTSQKDTVIDSSLAEIGTKVLGFPL